MKYFKANVIDLAYCTYFLALLYVEPVNNSAIFVRRVLVELSEEGCS